MWRLSRAHRSGDDQRALDDQPATTERETTPGRLRLAPRNRLTPRKSRGPVHEVDPPPAGERCDHDAAPQPGRCKLGFVAESADPRMGWAYGSDSIIVRSSSRR